MPNISEEKWIEMLEKKADGTYIAKYPKVKSKSGITFDEHLADITSQEAGKGADIIGLPDPNNLFTSTNVGGAMQELFTNVSNGKELVGGAITGVDDSVVIPTEPTFQDLATAIGSISTGKKWASGEGLSTSYQTLNGNLGHYLIINSMEFKPSVVIWFSSTTSPGGYYNDYDSSSDYLLRDDTGVKRPKSNCVIEEGMVAIQTVNGTFNWIAFE